MQKQSLLYGIIGLIIGAGITYGIMAAMPNKNSDKDSDMDMSMSQMTESLKGKSGDDFDKTFINEMIMHHQGAVDMANLVKTQAKHQEIKDMANDIVSAQTKEINQMKSWQTSWGYTTSGHDMMNMNH
ncbi:MAG TPA: DUF305 domain-containing protein [Candidatus Saccharimonadales bacterium]|nr:DUF305 domain-containing protein [Candidatus Saccharimonadales bacterium]